MCYRLFFRDRAKDSSHDLTASGFWKSRYEANSVKFSDITDLFDNELGKLNSDAKIAARESEKYRTMFLSLLETVLKEVQHEAAVNP